MIKQKSIPLGVYSIMAISCLGYLAYFNVKLRKNILNYSRCVAFPSNNIVHNQIISVFSFLQQVFLSVLYAFVVEMNIRQSHKEHKVQR